MNKLALTTALVLANLAGTSESAERTAAYAGQERREIKALSADDITSLETGKGMGLAKAAELNGYPGPSHVLQLAEPLALTPEQKRQTQLLFDSMESKAIPLGKALVVAERSLDELFFSGRATPALVSSQLVEIGRLQAQVRDAHLGVHLAQAALLTNEQKLSYQLLRGYAGGDKASTRPSAHKH